MRRLSGFLVAVVFLGFITTPAAAQDDEWQNKWYWGVQAGAFLFSTPTMSNEMAIEVGGHWLITAERVGLHIAYSEVLFDDNTTSAIPDGTATGLLVNLSTGRRLQAELYAYPMLGPLQLFAGGGFHIHYLPNAQPVGTFASSQAEQTALQAIDAASTKAFFVFTGGLQWRLGRWALSGTYQFIPSARDFLLTGTQNSIALGLRYALVEASESITTNR
jgi:hypothetical protein